MLQAADVQTRIEREYARRTDKLGWRLLYSPWRTVERADVAFIGLNPGVGPHSEEHGELSVEQGSAYVLETWKHKPGESVLQRQVVGLFKLLGVEPEKVLAGNLIPFRSRNASELANSTEATAFGSGLWREILDCARPRLVVTMGWPVTKALKAIGDVGEFTEVELCWGSVKGFAGNGRFRLVGLPHLSRFTVINREASRPGLNLLFLDDLKQQTSAFSSSPLRGGVEGMQPKDLVKEFYARYQRRDLDKALDLCTDDIDFLWTADARHARFSGPALGKAAFRSQLEALDKRFVYQAYTPLEVIAEGDKVAVRAVIRMTQREGGREFLMQVADFWTVRDGKLAAMVEYYDTALAAQVE